MVRYLNKITIIIFTIFMVMNLFTYEIYGTEKSNVLFITTDNPQSSDFDKKVDGIESGLGEDINLHIKYLSINDVDNMKQIKNTFKEEKYDSVIVGDYYTLNLAVNHRNDIFKNMPIVFFGISDDELIQKAIKHEKISGIKEVLSIESTINLIKKFHTATEKIVIINNYEDSNEIKYLKDNIIPKFKDTNFEFIYTSKLSIKEFTDKIKSLDENDAILTIYPNDFKNSYWKSDEDINTLISENANKTPIYSVLEEGVGNGSIGGKVASIYSEGQKAGEITKDFINGQVVKPIYTSDEYCNLYTFDYINLNKFSIRLNMLPINSKLIHSPKDVVYLYKGIFIFILLFIISLIVVIITLVRYLAYKKKYEETLEKSMKEVEEINRLKNHFIINMNHELKTPITVINAVMQLTKHMKKHDEKYLISNKNIALVEENCQRLLKLVNNIIDIEKIDSKEIDLNMENVNIVEVIEDTVLSVVPYAQAKNIEIVFDTTEEEITMFVDKNKIERIVLNLLSNAIKYSKEIGFIDVKIDVKEENLVFIVEDDGIGIDEENLNKIFDRFVRLDDSLTRSNEGSGIGLAIVKAFVECHNGSISVKSIKNVGTTFIINIPIIVKHNINDNIKQLDTDNHIKQELADIYL